MMLPMHLRRAAGLFSVLLILSLCPSLRADPVEEKWPNGKTRLRYNQDKDGKKAGEYLEYYDSGKIKLRAHYLADELNGSYASFHPNGKPHITATYKVGKLTGDYSARDEEGKPAVTATYVDGELQGTKTIYEKGKPVSAQGFLKGALVFPKGLEQIREELLKLLGPDALKPDKPDRPHRRPARSRTSTPTPEPEPKGEKLSDNEAGLHRLMAYRYLTDLPYQDMTLDDDMTKAAKAGADLCAKIGKLDHTPANPGLPEAQFALAYKGTSHSNLAQGAYSSSENVDMWMDDSDDKNIARVGHRRWCLNPTMLKTGFGRNGEFGAMWSFDESRQDVPAYDFVAFPPRGYMPTNGYFGVNYAWSVSLNPQKYQAPAKTVKVSVYPLDARFNKDAKSLDIDAFTVISETDAGGRVAIPNCLIFRPEKLDISSGKRYWVEITGLKTPEGEAAKVEYLVEFVDLSAPMK